MKRSLVAALFLLGCAHEEARPQAASCSISQVDWASADHDFDKARTAQTLDKLNGVIRADRDAFRADPSGRALGARLSDLTLELKTGPFVAHSAAETATRLRQLECAIQRGTFNGRAADADHLYGEILGDAEKELQLAKAQ